MKHCTFYSLVYDGKTIAKLQNGYTDGLFNYYCTKYNGSRTWYAVEPSTGLSVATSNTLKEAAQKATAPAMLKACNEKITQSMIQRFWKLRQEAEMLQYTEV
jgi:hypothetical protein